MRGLVHGLATGLLIGLALAVPATAGAQPAAAERPRIGLVLGGGGARGAAHIGVLEVLERERIAVDCVAGTSMGALVAGAWAAGLTPAQMREALAQADWPDMFQDNPDYADLNFRSKRLSQRFLPGSETGLTANGAVTPPGVVSGQKIKLFFNRLVRADSGEREIDRLALPVSIVATDIGSGRRVVLRDGSLTQAMRASMSVPGLLAPLEYRGAKLVDGGLVDNVPVREVRERCGAEVVIAVNVGSPLLPPERVSGLLSITAQMVALLTEQNVQASLASLDPARDILIQPELGTITAADFERHDEAARRGAAAAEAVVARLRALAVAPERWAAWRAPMITAPPEPPRIDAVEIAGLSRVDEAVVQRYLGERAGRPLDTATLDRDLLRAYGDGWYERVDYAVLAVDGKNVLRVTPVEKSWGPDYLRLGLRLDSNLSQGSTYQLRAAYHRTWLNRLGGEWLLTGELGSSTGVETEWFQPVDRGRLFFVDALAGYRRERNDVFFVEQRIAEYRSVRSRIELTGGLHFSLVGQVRAGWRESKVTRELETGLDVLAQLPERSAGGPLVAIDLDQFDRLYFPRRGWSVAGEWFHSDRRDYSRIALDLRGAVPLPGAAEWVIGSRASWVSSPRGSLPLVEAGRLGGLLNMTAFASGQLVGDEVGYAHLRAERIVGRAPLGLRGDLRLGLALEAGRVGQPYARQKQDGWLHSVAVYLGGETVLGPVFVGLGRGSGGSTNAYLVIGTP